MTLDDARATVARHGMTITGWFYPEPGHGAPDGTETLLLLGYGGGALWRAFTGDAEYADGEPHPLDRWSARVVSAIATGLDGEALFPFGGPPYQPFIRWMYAGEPLHQSRLGMAIHPERGLWSGWRGAVALPDRM